MKTLHKKFALTMIGLAAMPMSAQATDGYFSHGYGMRAKGMGGAATASAADTFGGANNPASMVWVGNRFDVGVDYFRPTRSASRSGSGGFGAGSLDFSQQSESESFFIPEFGYNTMLSPDLSLGITVYGNGGMNTDYPGGQLNCGAGPGTANPLCGGGHLGVDLSQLIFAPTLAYKFAPEHSVGVSPLFGYQRFKAEGLQAFDNAPGFPPFTSAPGSVTNRGYDSATGFGVRVGYMGKLTDGIAVGAAYSSKINMGKLDKYKGLFAQQGDFDIPENYNVGIAIRATPELSVAADYQRINYSKIASVGNTSNRQAALGTDNGLGFGWKDADVFKLGVEYAYSNELTLRGGVNHVSNPVQSSDVTFNIIAPGVVENHLTLGATLAMDKQSALTFAYMHAFENSVSGSSLFNNFGPGVGGMEKIKMTQNSFGISYGRKF